MRYQWIFVVNKNLPTSLTYNIINEIDVFAPKITVNIQNNIQMLISAMLLNKFSFKNNEFGEIYVRPKRNRHYIGGTWHIIQNYRKIH